MKDINIDTYTSFDMIEYKARKFALDYMYKNNYDFTNTSIYQFGVWRGGSLIFIDHYLKNLGISPTSIYGFDSFKGFPYEKDNIPFHKAWKQGNFDVRKFFEENSIDTIIDFLQSKLYYTDITYIIPGFFEHVLNDTLCTQFNLFPASFIDIDCDLYVSTRFVLDYMIKQNLIKENTIIVYDDWGGVSEYSGGESLAHKEWVQQYNIECEEIFSIGKMPNIQKVFKIKGISE